MSRTIVHREITHLNQPLHNVWGIISAFGAIKAWMPSIDSCSLSGDGIGAVRTVYWSGNVANEQLEILDPMSHTISYRILDPIPLPVSGMYGTVSLEETAEGKTQLTWTCDAEKVEEEGAEMVKEMMNRFIVTCVKGLKEVLERPATPLL